MRAYSAQGGHSTTDFKSDPCVLSLDVGTSSVRTLLFDAQGREVAGFGVQIPCHVATTPDGGFEIDADHLAGLCLDALTHVHSQMKASNLRPVAVACCAFWHSILGVGPDGRPTTPIIHLFDTRSAAAARKLAERIDARAVHSRTGCVLHPSYVPAKLLWLSETRPDVYRATRHWMSFGEYFFLKLFGRSVASLSMISGSGLWNQNESEYDLGLLQALPLDRSQLARVEELDEPLVGLRAEHRSRWPEFAGAQWYPALGDGACNNIGSGCYSRDRVALMVGTSGAMRVVLEKERVNIPEGLWCYRVDRKRFVLGGALSNGGLVFEWMKRTLVLPGNDEAIEKELAEMAPGSHGLTVLPLFAGERSPNWRADARAAISGVSMHTRPVEILRAALESVALRFRIIYDLMTAELGLSIAARAPSGGSGMDAPQSNLSKSPAGPDEIIASGGALLHSRAWTQIIADALGRPLIVCLEKEPSSRGAALLALERLGVIDHVSTLPARMGPALHPRDGARDVYDQELRRQRWLYRKLFEENGTT